MFTPSERASFPSPGHSPASPKQACFLPQFGIESGKGRWKIKRIWVGQGEEEGVGDGTDVDGVGTVAGCANADKGIGKSVRKELFEGYISFSISYDTVCRKTGYGSGSTCWFMFWRVRAMRDITEKDIGLGPGKEEGTGVAMRKGLG